MIYTIKKSKDCTKDGYFVYDLRAIPQTSSYIIINSMFYKNDKEADKKIRKQFALPLSDLLTFKN